MALQGNVASTLGDTQKQVSQFPVRHCERSEAIQGPQYDRLDCCRPACCGPWIAHMGILASMVDFSFSCCGFFDVAGAGFRRAESAVELMEARFSGGGGL